MTTAIYGRTSKDDQRQVTIEIQKGGLRQWTEEDGEVDATDVLEFWDVGISGTIP